MIVGTSIFAMLLSIFNFTMISCSQEQEGDAVKSSQVNTDTTVQGGGDASVEVDNDDVEKGVTPEQGKTKDENLKVNPPV
ncbi:hypothetical protein HERIO_2382 [Hepatospora eriocheir]|uniref:Uncharacterized protein n=1 Tax=Hepatospora eriocheir TaxID=1081669 RepID=A0A1X0Q768_9MICR|nr:hypothetical protein HERIO_2382 [Hepatospora eriocheir]